MIKDGEKHRPYISILDAVGTTKVELMPKLVTEGKDGYVKEDEEVDGRFGTFICS